MRLLVRTKLAGLCESLVTVVTLVWFLSSMKTHMLVQLTGLFEGPATLGTAIGLLSCVKSHMLLQLACLLKGFVTDFTRERPFVSVCTEVLIQVTGLLEALVALRAFVWPMFVMVENMFLKLFSSLENSFTHSAIKGSTS